MGRLYLPSTESSEAEVEDRTVYGRMYVGAAPEPEAAEEETEPTDEQPAGNASREEWVEFAISQGASEEDLVDADGKDLGRDALREKYGTPSE